MWARLYENAATTDRATLVRCIAALERCDRPAVEAAWAELRFCVAFPRSRKAAVERIGRRILQRHDTYARVGM